MKVKMSLLATWVVMTVVLTVKYEGAMKRISFVFGAAMAAIFALTSCNKEISNPDEIIKDGIPFEISAASADTKTSNDGIATNWVADDAINLYHAEAGSTTYTNDGSFSIAEEDLESKKFKGKLADALVEGNYDWYAFYPYSSYNKTPAGSSQDDFGFTTIGGTSQTQTGNNSTAHLCGKVCPLYGVAKSVASSATPGITMNHLTSIIEVNVTNNSGADLTVSNVSFTGTEDIVGTYYIDFTGETVVYTLSGANFVSKTASLTVNDGTAIADKGSATFYIAIKPFAVSNGVLKVAVNGYEKEITISNKTIFTAGKIKTINFNYNPEPSVQMGPDWNAIFGTSYSGAFSTNANELLLKGQKEEVSIVVRNGKSTNGYVKDGDFRMYNGYTVTLTPPSGKIITRVSTTKGGSKDFSSGIAANTGSVDISDSSLKWLGKSTNLVLTISGTVSFNIMNITIDDAPSEITKLTSPTVSCSSHTANSLTFTWSAVENATGYQVSVDGGNSYGSTQRETTYTWTGLSANTTKTLYVKAIGDSIFYTDSEAASAEGTTDAQAGGETPADYIFATSASKSNTSYASNYDVTISEIEWSVPGNQQFSGYVRIGGKNLSSAVRCIYSKTALPVGYKTITMSTNGKSNTNLTVESVVCKVYSSATGAQNGNETDLIATMINTDSDWAVSTAKTIVFNDASSAAGSERYYRFEFTLSNSNSSNYGIDLQKIIFSAN